MYLYSRKNSEKNDRSWLSTDNDVVDARIKELQGRGYKIQRGINSVTASTPTRWEAYSWEQGIK